MTSSKETLRKWALIAYIFVVCGAILLYVLKVPWQQNIKIVLGYYEEISFCFTVVICFLIPFRLYYVKQNGIVPETRKFRMFGPFVAYIFDPLYDAILFYSALFILHTIFQTELSLDPLLVLLLVSGILLYESLTDVFKLSREIFYARTVKKVAEKET